VTTLEFTLEIAADIDSVFAFHCDVRNVRVVTPSFIPLRFTGAPERLIQGGRMTVGVFTLFRWTPWDVRVETLRAPELLVDVQDGRGPFVSWRHEHRFRAANGLTVMTDRITYELPGGILGRSIDALFVRRLNTALFRYRHRRMLLHFRRP